MFKRFRRDKLIKKAVQKTVDEYSNCTPKIFRHLFYGAVDIDPNSLVIWYIFETDKELQTAKNNGLCDRLTNSTKTNLLSMGYPLDITESPLNKFVDKITFVGGTENQHNTITKMLISRKARVSFTSNEDIDNKANGNYYLYFK